MFFIPFLPIILVAGGAFAAGRYTNGDVGLTAKINKWLEKYTEEDRDKIESIYKIYNRFLIGHINLDQVKAGTSQATFDEAKIEKNAVVYEIGNALPELQVHKQILGLSEFHVGFLDSRNLGLRGVGLRTPENLVLEEFKCWLAKISRCSSDNFNPDLQKEIRDRIEYFRELLQINAWRPGFRGIITKMRKLTETIEARVKYPVFILELSNTINNLITTTNNALEKAVDMLCFAITDDGVRNQATKLTVGGLLGIHDKLRIDFYSYLVLCVINSPPLLKVYGHEPIEGATRFPAPEDQNEQKRIFRELAIQITQLAAFIHICKACKTMQALGGSLFLRYIFRENNLLNIGDIHATFCGLVKSCRDTMDRIESILEERFNQLHMQLGVVGFFHLNAKSAIGKEIAYLEEVMPHISALISKFNSEMDTSLEGLGILTKLVSSRRRLEEENELVQQAALCLLNTTGLFIEGVAEKRPILELNSNIRYTAIARKVVSSENSEPHAAILDEELLNVSADSIGFVGTLVGDMIPTLPVDQRAALEEQTSRKRLASESSKSKSSKVENKSKIRKQEKQRDVHSSATADIKSSLEKRFTAQPQPRLSTPGFWHFKCGKDHAAVVGENRQDRKVAKADLNQHRQTNHAGKHVGEVIFEDLAPQPVPR
jgi:hypothetical protein